ncbi:YvcK family protein [Lutibacter sp. B2]|nr:YvcK family protein [Lutibacter sp. B2]
MKGIENKKWCAGMIIGFIFVIIGVGPIIFKMLEMKLITPYYFSIVLAGMVIIIVSLVRRNRINEIVNHKKINEEKILKKAPKIVVIGGGTGLSILLRGLKQFTTNLTAIVTVADDGGGSGVLREDLGMLPPGDIRNCILALADTEPIMEKLLQYRFTEGMLKGQSFGNLLIAAMNGISTNFEETIKKINDVLAVTGKVLPVTLEDITLYAKLKNGDVIKGESQIPLKTKELKSEIEEVFIKPNNAKPPQECIEAIYEADVIILGPGSLYTSIIPNLLVKDITKAIKKSVATKVYISNVMTQPGETDDYSVYEHVEAIIGHMKKGVIDYVFVNNEEIPSEILEKYITDGAKPIQITEKDRKKLREQGISIIEDSFVNIKKKYIRHDAYKLSQLLIKLVLEEKYSTDKTKILDYYLLKDKFKC